MVLCRYADCIKRAYFALTGESPIYCGSHKSDGMVNVHAYQCMEDGCTTVPTFGVGIGERATHCSKHKSTTMVNVKAKRCTSDSCPKQASFGFEKSKPLCCVDHKSDEMINTVSKKCESEDCEKPALYGTDKVTHCKAHKTDKMTCLKSKICKHPGCKKNAVYGLVMNKPTHCREHNVDELDDVVSKRCLDPDCDKRPYFGLKGGKATHCADHRSDVMENVRDKTCIEVDCDKIPYFGIEWGFPTHCGSHKADDMVDVKHKRCCVDGCTNRPIYGLVFGKATNCADHKSDEMSDACNKKILCTTCCASKVNPKYKPNCARCHFYLNPTDPRIRNFKTKEQAFMVPLQKLYPDMVLDKRVEGGCSNRRPDGLIDCFTHSIIIEIDEDQHVGYNPDCDNLRTMQLFGDLNNRPIVVIRLNPDFYKTATKRTNGVFTLDRSTGLLKMNKNEFQRRFDALTVAIRNALPLPERELTYVKLFYTNE